MRGNENNQSELFHTFSIEELIPSSHPLRRVRSLCEEALKQLEPVFETMYSDVGRPSIAPERLLKSQILIALYSIRSDALFCETLGYHILFRWFLGMSMSEAVFDRSTFSKNRERLIDNDVGKEFLAAVVSLARKEGLTSSEHFTVDGTLIEAWASLKSLQPKAADTTAAEGKKDKGDRNPDADFRGEKRTNDTHSSKTDPESQLYKKGKNRESKLSFLGHSLMENRNGLIIDAMVTAANGSAEREATLQMLDRQEIEGGTLGADKGYHAESFIAELRKRKIVPHIAFHKGRLGLDARTTRHKTYAVSQRKRKLVEQGFGWLKTIAGMRKTTLRGISKTDYTFSIRAAVYNILRIRTLCPA